MLKAPAKITFKNSTKMTLNARFTTIMKSRPPTKQTVRAQASTRKLASEKNRRLAQQMGNRPTVEAALGSSQQYNAPPARKSILDRLGVRGRGKSLSLSTRGNVKGNNFFRSQSATSTRARGILRGAMRRGTYQTRGISTRGRGFSSTKRGGRGTIRGASRGRGRGGNSKGAVFSAGRINRGGVRKRGGFRGRGRGRGGQRGGKAAPVDKSKLDNELDSYMSKTRGSMDAELDNYMANAGGD